MSKLNTMIKKTILFIFTLIFFSFIIPVKITLNSMDSIAEESCFIVHQISSGSTEAGLWLCNGDVNGIWTDDAYIVALHGNIPQDVLSSDVYSNGETMFVIYGTLADPGMTADEVNVINCDKWEFIGDISRDSASLRLRFKKYITIYDLKLFDGILS
ncbi:MAG: hypothetical protein K2J71_08685 [Oscillospiraceae bacterium]|nr:hypothetical protein [Oscillospiraceae bacterium]